MTLEAVPTVYRCVVADPPWPERGGGKIKRGADKHYPLLPVDQILTLMQNELDGKVAEDAHLWIWVTNNYLPAGLRIMGELGFRYITNLCWHKDRISLGQYLRGEHELCIFGSRGKAHLPETAPPSVVTAVNVGAAVHSRKPQEAFDRIRKVSPGPRLEMFARQRRSGFDAWGNEAPA